MLCVPSADRIQLAADLQSHLEESVQRFFITWADSLLAHAAANTPSASFLLLSFFLLLWFLSNHNCNDLSCNLHYVYFISLLHVSA